MNPDIKVKWLEALRSGRFQQARHYLKITSPGQPAGYCCLGVLAEILGVPSTIHPEPPHSMWPHNIIAFGVNKDTAVLPIEARAAAGVTGGDWCLPYPVYYHGHNLDSLAELNDNGMPFNEIADIIEAQL